MRDWRNLLGTDERAVIERAQWGGRVGFGRYPALLVIDVQNYMVGVEGTSDNAERFPFSCGPPAFAALGEIASLIAASRRAGIPVIYTRFVLNPGADQTGFLHNKIGLGRVHGENLYFSDTFGAEIVDEVAPLPHEPIIDKCRRSAFFGTHLLPLLRSLNVDTCVVVGGSTSGCIRPTVCDAEQNDFRVIVPEEAVFDRLSLVHAVNLFDMDRSQADVLPTSEVLQFMESMVGSAALAREGNNGAQT